MKTKKKPFLRPRCKIAVKNILNIGHLILTHSMWINHFTILSSNHYDSFYLRINNSPGVSTSFTGEILSAIVPGGNLSYAKSMTSLIQISSGSAARVSHFPILKSCFSAKVRFFYEIDWHINTWLLPCLSMGPKWFWTVQIILVEYQLFWTGPIRFGLVKIILDRSKL